MAETLTMKMPNARQRLQAPRGARKNLLGRGTGRDSSNGAALSSPQMEMPEVAIHRPICNKQHRNAEPSAISRTTQQFIYVTEITEGDKT